MNDDTFYKTGGYIMNSMKKFTVKGIIACVLMVLVVVCTLFSSMFILRGEVLEELEETVDMMEESLEYYDVDDLEEYFEELGYDNDTVEAGVKVGKFLYRIEDGRFSVFDVISAVSCFSAMNDAPSTGIGRPGAAIGMFIFLGILLVAFYMAIPLLGILYICLHIAGCKNKGVPVLVLLAVYVGLVGGITTLMSLVGDISVSISIFQVLALGFAIAAVALWKVEKQPQQGVYQQVYQQPQQAVYQQQVYQQPQQGVYQQQVYQQQVYQQPQQGVYQQQVYQQPQQAVYQQQQQQPGQNI